VKQPRGSTSATVLLRQLFQRFAFLAMVVAAFGLMLIGKADTVLMERTRTLVSDAVSPILDALSRPAASVADFVANVRDLTSLRAENARLRTENETLLNWQTVARKLEAENRALKDLSSISGEGQVSYITSRVIADNRGAYVHNILINVGERDGVRKGQAALTGLGLVGRVAEVGHRSARILLITDIKSRVPVSVESSRAKAILAGDNSSRPKLMFITNNAHVVPGDRIVTSSSGGAFPPGLPIGVVASSDEGGIRVEPFVDSSLVEYIRVVDYGLEGIIPGIEGMTLEK